MDLVTRGRLSVQRVGEDAWAAIELMAQNGGWEELDMKPKKKGGKVKGSISNVDNPAKQDKTRVNPRNHDDDESKDEKRNEQGHIALNASAKRKRGTVYTDVEIGDIGERPGVRRSNRAKK